MTARAFARVFLLAVIFALVPTKVGHAHGEPIISLSPAVAAAGTSITVTGTEMEPGEVFQLFLENASTSIELGEPHLLDRSKPAGEIAGAALLAMISAVLGVWLIRRKEPNI